MNWVRRLVVMTFLLTNTIALGEGRYKVKIVVDIECPPSEEFQAFIDSHPKESQDVITDYQEWKIPFIENMTKLIQLVESEKLYNSSWSVNYEEIQL
jgi:hypothetical protein